MFDISDTKLFMDIVHGYIYVPKLFIEHIIDTEEFQRLHYVDQTGMKPVYPAAKHDRFIHSLGVYHLGLKAADALLNNFKETTGKSHWYIRSNDSLYIFWAKTKVLFLLACLLHDVGHAPYSHSMEHFFVEGANGDALHEKIAGLMGLKPDSEEYICMKKAAPHEKISALMVLEKFKPAIKQVLDGLGNDNYPQIEERGYSEYERTPLHLNSSELESDVCFIARMIMGVKFTEYQPEYQIRNCFIELLNGQNFDVDKLDYIIRDTKMSGISNIALDVDRLLNALTIIPITNYHDHEFPENAKFTSENEHTFLLNLVPYVNEVLTIEGKIDTPLRLRNATVKLQANAVFSLHNADKNGNNIGATIEVKNNAYFSESSNISKYNNGQYEKLKADPQSKDIVIPYGGKETYIFQHAKVLNSSFHFSPQTSGATLNLENEVNVCVSTSEKTQNDLIVSAHLQGTVQGKVKEMRVLGDHLGDIPPTEHAYISFSIGYKKQATNIITNVMDARNYLYLWIYAHHKVVYYANYMVIELSRLSQAILTEKQGRGRGKKLSDKFRYQNFIERALDENTMIELMRGANEKNQKWKEKKDIQPDEREQKIHQQFEILYHEFFSRKYKKSVYKSLAEYDIFFSEFTPDEKARLRQLLPQVTQCNLVEHITDAPKYGFWEGKELKKTGLAEKLKCLMWVDASYSKKLLDVSKVYICFGQNTLNVERLPILKKDQENINTYGNYFYLYYEWKSPEMGDASDNTMISKALIRYFKKLLEQSKEIDKGSSL